MAKSDRNAPRADGIFPDSGELGGPTDDRGSAAREREPTTAHRVARFGRETEDAFYAPVKTRLRDACLATARDSRGTNCPSLIVDERRACNAVGICRPRRQPSRGRVDNNDAGESIIFCDV